MLTIRLPPLYAKQQAALFDPAQVCKIDGSTKSGKTVGAMSWQLDQAINVKPKHLHLWVAPIHPQAEVAFLRVRRMLQRCDELRGMWDSNISKQTISLPGGSTWRFMGSENFDSIYGRDAGSAVIDEDSRCREEAYHAVISVLTATGGKMRSIGNVKGRGNWAYRLGAQARAGMKGVAYHKLTAGDALEAGVIKQEVLDAAEALLPHATYRELYWCEPADDGGNPFSIKAIEQAFNKVYTPGPPVYFGVDLAKKQDWTVVEGQDANGNEVVFERWRGLPWGDTIDRIKQIIGGVPAHVDSTGIGDAIVDGLLKAGCAVEGYLFSLPSKQKIMECLAVEVQSGRHGFRSQVAKSEMDVFEYEMTRTGVRYSAPPGLHDDCVYAKGLCAYGRLIRPSTRIYTAEPKPIVTMTFEQRRAADPNYGFGDD